MKKQKRSLPHSEQSEWRESFTESKRQIESILANIRDADVESDRMVYELYGLTDEEIGIVEGME